MSKTTNKSGFTIIEVVITIAIGAAVMALVLNAVAGARRSQRNNARSADVNQIAAGINQYIGTRNDLPQNWGDISPIIDSAFGHYDPGANTTSSTSYHCAGSGYSLTTANPPQCDDGMGSIVAAVATTNTTTTTESINPIGAWNGIDPTSGGVFPTVSTTGQVTPPTTPSTVLGGSDASAADKVVVWLRGACSDDNLKLEQGGIREVAIFYRLEGQDSPLCIEV